MSHIFGTVDGNIFLNRLKDIEAFTIFCLTLHSVSHLSFVNIVMLLTHDDGNIYPPSLLIALKIRILMNFIYKIRISMNGPGREGSSDHFTLMPQLSLPDDRAARAKIPPLQFIAVANILHRRGRMRHHHAKPQFKCHRSLDLLK